MEGYKGKEMRQKTLKWKKKAEAATNTGGSSYKSFERLIEEAFHGPYI
jgi:hypothetical protein